MSCLPSPAPSLAQLWLVSPSLCCHLVKQSRERQGLEGWREAAVSESDHVALANCLPVSGLALGLELEWLDVEHRVVAGILSSTFWTGGVLLLALAGYLIRDWRWLLTAVTLPCVMGILSIR